MAEIFAAVPPGSRRCRSQREWQRAALNEIEGQGWYANRAAHYSGIARRLALCMDWRLRTSRPGHEHIASSVGVSTDTVARCVAWLQGRGLLGLVSPGTTPDLRPGVLYAGTGNLAAVYLLTVPRRKSRALTPVPGQDNFADLSRSRSELDKAPRAREARTNTKGKSERPPGAQPVLPRPANTLHTCPQTRSEGLAAALAVQEHARDLRRLSPEHVRHVSRPYFAAGWTPADVMHALDHEPSGRQHGYTSGIRSPAAWAKYRLGLWLGPDGLPLPSRSQLVAAARRRVLAEQAGRRAQRRTTPADPSHAARAREMLMHRLAEIASRRRPADPESVPPESVSPVVRVSASAHPRSPRPAPGSG
jgi:hypothetical protein